MVFCNVVRLSCPAQTYYIKMGHSFHLEMISNSAVFSNVAVVLIFVL